ncbi:large ribosomal subunit protein mL54-like [Saccostrea echinata]|uniref:large ribosomal subunit protein mL54-like n=1 Tax=Saccostrea echinata TaxID=191078 RepID=UPI002A80480D|nr:large ribosomal subunit protein mL54-like [Saccostrea echinata]
MTFKLSKSFAVCKSFCFVHFRTFHISAVQFAKKDVKGLAKKVDKFLDAEKDPEKLCKYVCGANIMNKGSDPEIKPDSEYPEWLWNLKIERGAYEHEPGTHKYWRLVRRRTIQQMNKERRKV